MELADLNELSPYLKQFIVEQRPELYTAIDHASWRFIMRISSDFFSETAHPKYHTGVRSTGMSTERVPLVSEMDQAMQKLGWRAVPISGFIPPAAFIEFGSKGILPIACEMRKLENINYTPAPDIVHEAAGHAPFIADPDYGAFLRRYGDVARKAIYSAQDEEVYDSILELSVIKEDPDSSKEDIATVQSRLDRAIQKNQWVSESTKLSRLFWWTSEYGLVGDLDDPLIYGAGLLSSVGESFDVFFKNIKKVPLSIECLDVDYDITQPQPQLFIVKHFRDLVKLVDQFRSQMAFTLGGSKALEIALKAKTTTTSELDSGLQVSGTLAQFLRDDHGEPSYLQFQGPSQLSFQHQQLEGHGPRYHAQGFGSPIGRLKGFGKSAADLSQDDLKQLGLGSEQKARLEFESGVCVEGLLRDRLVSNSKNMVLIFEDCRVTLGDEVLFDPSWGTFDMACGATVDSVFGGAAQRSTFMEETGGSKIRVLQPKTNLRESNRALNDLYAEVRAVREEKIISGAFGSGAVERTQKVFDELERSHQEDWLLRLEILELIRNDGLELSIDPLLKATLKELDRQKKVPPHLVERGLRSIS